MPDAEMTPLFTPFTLGSLTLPNRFAMAPMTRCFSPGGVPGANVADYYRRRAEGGVGLIVTEGVGVDHPSALGSNDFDGRDIPVMYGEDALAGWRRVVDAVHAAGARIVPQLWHQGVMRPEGTGPFPDHPSSRPSGLWGPDGKRTSIPPETVSLLLPETRPVGESEIADIIAGFARSAAHARDVGFDGIAIHGAHGYLLDTFLWGETNRRADGYGGDHVARTRFAVELIAAVRSAIGPDLPIVLRFSQWKQQDFDAKLVDTPRELEQMLGPIADAGVDMFEASTRDFRRPAFDGSDLNLAGWAKTLTGKPAMTVGGIGFDKDLYESYAGGARVVSLAPLLERFARGEFDLVAIGRGLIADPSWVAKVRDGRERSPFDLAMLATLD
jgi:2,4-dienoyl-CoA reductase-like NADH-dependent reductase (Old Yellow Enzyme family)